MPERDTECYNRIRFAIDDADGKLRFRRIGVEGGVFCEGVLKQLEAYLKERPLRDVDLKEVRSITSECRPDCGQELVRIIGEHKEFFCGRDEPQNA
ncbi:MAG: hypothetical protein JW808_01425 [Victivallales bacterium]|nr:hypothetical protein [Victivallales bacterium]